MTGDAREAAQESVNQLRLYWAIRPNGLVYGPVTKVPTNHPDDWVIVGMKPDYVKIHIDGTAEEWDLS